MEERKTKLHRGKVKRIFQTAADLYKIEIETNDFKARAGQFISLLCDNCTLRRPFSVMDFHDGLISILFKIKGKGTEYIKNLKAGDEVNFTGAFGNGFTLTDKRSLVVGAGVGIAPVFF